MANLRMERIGPMELRPGPLKVRKLLAGAGSPELKGVGGPHFEKPGVLSLRMIPQSGF